MEKSKHSLIRLELIDGESVCGVIESNDPNHPDEVLSMLAGALACILHDCPKSYRSARRLMRRVFRDYRPESPLDYFIEHPIRDLLGAGVLFGILYGFASLMRAVGVA